MDPVSVVAMLSSAVGLTTKLTEFAGKWKDADAKNALADLRLQLADIKDQVFELMEERRQLKEEISRINAELEKARAPAEVEFRQGVYWKPDDEVPFCTTCYDKDKKLIRLKNRKYAYTGASEWRCDVCGNFFGKS